MESSECDPCFYDFCGWIDVSMNALYVNHTLIAGFSMEMVSKIGRTNSVQFGMKDLEEQKVLVRKEIHRNHSKQELVVSQSKYASDVLSRLEVSNCKPVEAPIDQTPCN